MGRFFFFSAAIFLFSIQNGQCAHIVGGNESIPHSRPYMAAISFDPTDFFCGGSLINESWVLTAAHCAEDFWLLQPYVVLGAHEEKNETEKGRQHIKVSEWFSHPGYNRSTKEHDIMLLKLQKKAQIDDYVQLVQLPSTSDDVQPGTNCLVAGWGKTYYKQPKIPHTLHEVNLTVVDRNICGRYLSVAITNNMMCADSRRGGGKASCQGDSGGPLICGVQQRGIVSFGVNCGLKQYPDVYTFLTQNHISWIVNTIRQNT